MHSIEEVALAGELQTWFWWELSPYRTFSKIQHAITLLIQASSCLYMPCAKTQRLTVLLSHSEVVSHTPNSFHHTKLWWRIWELVTLTVECDKDSATNYMCAVMWHSLIPKLSPAKRESLGMSLWTREYGPSNLPCLPKIFAINTGWTQQNPHLIAELLS